MSGYVASETMRLSAVFKSSNGKTSSHIHAFKITNDWKYNFHPTSTHTAETSYLKSKDIFIE